MYFFVMKKMTKKISFMKFINKNCDEKLWPWRKSNEIKLNDEKNYIQKENCDKKKYLMRQKKWCYQKNLGKLKNLNYDKTQYFELWQNSKTHNMTKLINTNVTIQKNSNGNTTWKLKLFQNSKIQIVTWPIK